MKKPAPFKFGSMLMLSTIGLPFATTFEFYSQPSWMARSTQFSVKVNGTAVDVIGDINGYDYCQFSMDGGAASVEVTAKLLGSIGTYSVTPMKYNFSPTKISNRLTYTLPSAQYTIVNIQGTTKKLVIVADKFPNGPDSSGLGIFNVMNYGAYNDKTDPTTTTNAFNNAITDASAWIGGRGVVYVPAGTYQIKNITLKSKMELYLEPGAVLWFNSAVSSNYSTDWTSKGNGTRWIRSESGASNIKIWGRGTIDGDGLGCVANSFYNNMLVIDNSSGVTIDGIIIRAGGKWGTMIGRSDTVTINNVKFFQHMSGVGEDDGIDIMESQNVILKNSIACSFDDPFSIKSYDVETQYVGFGPTPTAHEIANNITVDSCIAYTGCHAFKLGQGVGQLMSNVTFKNSVVFDCAHGISIHHKAGTASIKNCTWKNIDIERVDQTNLGQSWFYGNIENTQTGPGPVQGLAILDITVRDRGNDANSPLMGYSASNQFTGVMFRNIRGAGVDASPSSTLSQIHVSATPFVTYASVKTAVTGAPVNGSTYYIQSGLCGKTFDIGTATCANGMSVTQKTWAGSTRQKWVAINNGDGSWRFQSAGCSTQNIEMPGSSITNGTALKTSAWTGANNQRWTLEDMGNGNFRIKNKNSVKALDNQTVTTNATVVQWDASVSGGYNQQWFFVK